MKKIVSIAAITVVAAVATSAMAFAAGDKAAGEAIYKKNCAGCHGNTGAGNGPAASSLKPKPANFVSADYKDSTGKGVADYSDADLEAIIANGRKGTAMPAWKKSLNAQQTADVLAYVRSLHQ